MIITLSTLTVNVEDRMNDAREVSKTTEFCQNTLHPNRSQSGRHYQELSNRMIVS